MRGLLVAAAIALAGLPAAADDDFFPPVAEPVVKEECGACHMAFQPQMLPRRSWRKIMETLADHFGEDASLDPATREKVSRWLVANAADASRSRAGRKMLRGVGPGQTPLRITELPRFVREHEEHGFRRMLRGGKVASAADCVACHRGAERGYYDDD